MRNNSDTPPFFLPDQQNLPLLFLGYGLISLNFGQSDEACPMPAGTQSTCVYQTDSGRIIDLRPLTKKDGTARYVVLVQKIQ